MKAIHLTAYGNPLQNLKMVEVADPGAPLAGEALVRMEYAPVDYSDLLLVSKGRFVWWPEAAGPAKGLEAYEAQLLMAAGDVSRVRAAPMWRRVSALK
jgi:NADPH:quinone reductase-like Zn-dependent oxidoreductase